jgi:hypothetical protein
MLFSASTQGVIKLHTKAMKLEENYIVGGLTPRMTQSEV